MILNNVLIVMAYIKTIILDSNYTLVIIENEDTPLSARAFGLGAVTGPMLIVALAFIIMLTSLAYIGKRKQLAARLLKLRKNAGITETECSKSIKELALEIEELESSITSDISLEL